MCAADRESVVIRTARPEDAAAMARLSGQLGYPAEATTFAKRLTYLAARPENGIFVAEREGAVLAWAHIAGRVLLESAPFAEVLGLIVDEAARKQGIGASLVDACLDWARTHGWQQVRVRSNVVRGDAHRFYERQGFTVSKKQVVFAMPIDQDAVA